MFNVLLKLPEFSSFFLSPARPGIKLLSFWVVILDPAVQVLATSFVSWQECIQEVLVAPWGFVINFCSNEYFVLWLLSSKKKAFQFQAIGQSVFCKPNLFLPCCISLLEGILIYLSQVGPGPAFCPIMCLNVLQFHILSRAQTCSSMLRSSSVTAGSCCAFPMGS